MTLTIQEKSIVTPGQELSEGQEHKPGDNTYVENNRIKANKLGIVKVRGNRIQVEPLSGRYAPQEGDKVIGKVTDINYSGWKLELNSAHEGMLNMRDVPEYVEDDEDLTNYFDIGDYLLVQITDVSSQGSIDLKMKGPGLHQLQGGQVIKIGSQKIPRLIGRQGSMVKMIKEKTGCKIIAGQNGLVWFKGDTAEDEILASETIKKINREAHKDGLTDIIKNYLEEQR